MTSDSRRFGSFVFDFDTHVLQQDGELIDLGRRASALLAALLARRGKVLTKGELFDAAWHGDAVEESNLSVQIAKLRAAIGPKWIRTVERVGYQFVAPDRDIGESGAATATLAVLPVANLGADASLLEVLGNELVCALVSFGSLSLVDSEGGSESRYRLHWSARQQDTAISIAARLFDLDSGTHFWSRTVVLSPSGGGIAACVDCLSSSIEGAVIRNETRLGTRDAGEADASHLYWRAKALLDTSRPTAYAKAAQLLEAALAQEPENTACLAALCEALHHPIAMGWPGAGEGAASRCRSYAWRGQDRPDVDGRCMALFGTAIYRTGDPDWGHALMQRAVELNPRDLTALVYAATANMHWGKVAIAEAQYRRGLQLDPQSQSQGFVMGGLARIRMMQGRFEDALRWAKRAQTINANYGASHWTLVAGSHLAGRKEEAGENFRRFRSLHPGVTVQSIRAGQPTRSGRMTSTLEGLEAAGLAA